MGGVCLLGSAVVHAGTSDFYLGAGAGVADFDDQVVRTDTGTVRLGGRDKTYKIYGGYRATRNFAVEGTYLDFGKSGEGRFSTKTDGLDVSAVGMLLLGPVDVFAKGGVVAWDTKGGELLDDHGKNLSWGLGGALKLGNVRFRVESKWFDVELPSNVQTVTASVAWSF